MQVMCVVVVRAGPSITDREEAWIGSFMPRCDEEADGPSIQTTWPRVATNEPREWLSVLEIIANAVSGENEGWRGHK